MFVYLSHVLTFFQLRVVPREDVLPRPGAISSNIKCHTVALSCASQAYIWYHTAIESTINIDPENYAFTCDQDENLVPIINDASQLPADFPFPCKCNKCKFHKRCPCRLKELACWQYCNCKSNCLNPL